MNAARTHNKVVAIVSTDRARLMSRHLRWLIREPLRPEVDSRVVEKMFPDNAALCRELDRLAACSIEAWVE